MTDKPTTGGGGSSAWVPPPQTITRWAVTSVWTRDSDQLRCLLHEGWEPFSVDQGTIWLRQKTESFK
jgi:hypothetical protein